MAERTCSECSKSLANKSVRAITCSDRCQKARQRRLARAKEREENYVKDAGITADELRHSVRKGANGAIAAVLKDELAPVVREAIDEDVLRAIDQMVTLTPAAVAALQEDLVCEDRTLRQRAYQLLFRYTVGHPALVKPNDEMQGGMVVNFNLPRPDEAPAIEAEVPDDAEPVMRECDMCNELKPEAEFVAGSYRCATCSEEYKARVLAQFS
jgi:DNA-directed RNA polymerase subunit RPC12/RpoP